MKCRLSIALLTGLLLISGCATKASKGNPGGYTADEVLTIVSKKLENPTPEVYGRCAYMTSPDKDSYDHGKIRVGVCFFDKNSLVFTPIEGQVPPKNIAAYSFVETPYKNLKSAGVSKPKKQDGKHDIAQVQMKNPDGSIIGIYFMQYPKPGSDMEKTDQAVSFLKQQKVPKQPREDYWAVKPPDGPAAKDVFAYQPPLSAKGQQTFENFTGEGAACISSESGFLRIGDDVNVRIEYINSTKTSGVGAFWVGDLGKTGPYCVEPTSVIVNVFAVASDKALNKNFTIDAKRGAKYQIGAKVNGDNFDFKVEETFASSKAIVQEVSVPWNKFVDPDNMFLFPAVMPNGSMWFF